jgi:Spy/CpxP family protein refolding chaperone
MKKFAAAIAVTALGAAVAFAAPQHEGGKAWGHGHRHMHGVFSKRLAEKLNLTDAQKAQVKDIMKASRQENKAFFQQSRADMKAFFEAKKAGDTAKMDALKPTVQSDRAQMKAIRASEETKIASVLTPDQNAQWQQLKAQRAAKRAQRDQK